jgi:hypothetical protein
LDLSLSNLFGPDGALTRLFAANTSAGGQPPVAPTNPAQPATAVTPGAQPQLTPNYGDFYKDYLDAAAAREKAYGAQGGAWSWFTGTGRDAALASAKVNAPSAYFDLLNKQTGAQAGELDTDQTLQFLNRSRVSQGLAPLDASQLPAGFGIRAPNAGPSTAPPNAPQRAPQVDGNAGDNRAALFTGLADAMPRMPDAAFSPFAPSMQPPVSVAPLLPPQGVPAIRPPRAVQPAPLAPLAPPQTNAAPTNVPTILQSADALRNLAMPSAQTSTPPFGQPPAIPQVSAPQASAPVQPAPNPLDAQRAMFGRIASAMAGLPKYAAAVPEYLKAARAGLPEATDVNLDTGQVSDPISGQPETGDVGGLLARRAGQVATAQQIPHVEAEDYLARLNAGLTRGTDAARISGENAYKAPILMRAPDGSVVGVTPMQMAEATRTGALNGYRPLTEEDTKALGAMGETYVKEQAALPDVRKAQNTIQVMLDQAKAFPPGTFGDIRASAGRLLAGIGADQDQVSKIVGSPAGADVIMKNTMTLAMDRLRQSFGQAREAGFVLNMAMKANPNIETQPDAYSFMLNTMNQEAQRQADYLTAQQTYRAQHGTIDGFTEAFDQARPVATYANQALVDTYGAPAGSRFLGRSQGKPVFTAPNGKKFMVTH